MRELDQLRSAICRLQSYTISEALTPEIPDHIIFTILLKLPVNTLLRFLTLSKNFREIITSSIFVNQHMRLVRESTSSCSVICSLRSYMFAPSFIICRMSSNGYVTKFELPVKTSFHSEADFDPVFFIASEYHSCNGLLCLAQVIFGGRPKFLSLIWNPATGKYRKVIWPQMSEELPNVLCYTYMGFGYEPSIDDYKIVLLSVDNSGKWVAQVMSLKGDKWRTVDLSTSPCLCDGLGCNIGRQMISVAVNGVVYWIACHISTSCYVLLKFNLADESFSSFVPLPEGTQAVDSLKQRKLATLGGFLYLFVWENDFPFNDPRGHIWREVTLKFDIWKLQGHTWCKVATIPNKRRLYHPLGFDLSGHVIMVDWFEKSLVVYNPQNNRFLELNVKKVSKEIANFHFVQMETLVSP